MNNTQIQIVPSMDNISQLVEVESIDKPIIVNQFDNTLDPFTEIQKLPLQTQYGGLSKAHSIRLMLKGKDTEMGICETRKSNTF